MSDPRTDGSPLHSPAGEGARLDSWKKIAAHFRRDVTTVQRWERREGMPVHRHLHDKQGSVYAFRAELDAWWESRRGRLAESGETAAAPPTAAPSTASDSRVPPSGGARARGAWPVVAAIAAVGVVGYLAWKLAHPAPQPWRNPLANATVTRLTDWPGVEEAAEISRDGRAVAFLADRDGRMDAWLTQVGSGSYRNLTQGSVSGLVNPLIRTNGFSADGTLVTLWTRDADGSRPEDVRVMSVPVAGGKPQEFLPGAAEVGWSHDGRQIVYHTTAPGDPLLVRDEAGISRRIYVAPAGVHCHFPLWSADDAWIYFVRGVPPNDWDIWRIRPAGTGLERLTFHDALVSHPVWLDPHTLGYLASDSQGAGPWLYAVNVEQRVPHRLSFGLERYTSLSASASGMRLVATVEDSSSTIWRAPLPAADPSSATTRAAQEVSATGLSPRSGAGYLLYVSARPGRQGIWKLSDGQSRELWSDARAAIVGAPAIAPDGRRIAFTAADADGTVLYTMDSDGRALRAVSRLLALRGNPAWAPDGKSIVSAVFGDGEPRLTSIFLDGSPPSALVSEYSIDPVWSPDGRFLLYSGADVGTTFPLRAVAGDGRPYPIPALILTRGARRVVFLPGSRSIVVLRGEVGHKNFWLVDLGTGAERQLTELEPDITISDFDLAGDGGAILFDRIHASSRIALIERGG